MKLFSKSLITAFTAVIVSSSFIQPQSAEAFDIGAAAGAIIKTSAQHDALNKQIKYYDNEGRHEYFAAIKEKDGVDTDSYKNEMLDRIMAKLSASIAVTDPSIKEKPYNHFVNPQKTFNAYCTLGHNMSVNAGLFDLLAYNENEIAFVVGHEMGHGQKDHPVKGIKKSIPLDVIASIWGSQSGSGLETIGINVLTNYTAANYVTKPQEWEADNLAFDYAVNAGYNPGAGAALWQRVIEKMGESSTNFVGEIFSPSDHPENEDRRKNYSDKLTAYSNKHVTVDNGIIKLNNKVFMTAGAAGDTSSSERAYLIAGNLAAVYHNNKTAPAAYIENGMVKMGNQPILIPNNNEPTAQVLVNTLNNIK